MNAEDVIRTLDVCVGDLARQDGPIDAKAIRAWAFAGLEKMSISDVPEVYCVATLTFIARVYRDFLREEEARRIERKAADLDEERWHEAVERARQIRNGIRI